MNARDFKIPFGKYKGETLEEIYIEDRSYWDWLKETVYKDISNGDIRRRRFAEDLFHKIELCEKEMRNVRICK